MKHLEIERRYLLFPCSVKRLLRRRRIPYDKIPMRQFYLVAGSDRVERFRQEGERYVHTCKRGSGLTREEEEHEIDEALFRSALEKNRGGVIVKNRYVFVYEGRRYELDAFKGPLKGLNILEIEFPDTREALAFRLPAFLQRVVVTEVTENPRFTNGALSRSMRIPAIETDLRSLLAAVERRKSFLKASTDVALTPYESGRHAVKALLYSLLKSVEANRTAILAGDPDPERLHQLRVAMRKQRALLSQLSDLFVPEWAQAHKEALASLMRRTGPKRDLDVYLQQIDYYKSLLPPKYHGGIDRLARYLKGRYDREASALKAFLLEETFSEEMAALRNFCTDEKAPGVSGEAEGPVVLPVKRALKRRYRKILKKGAAIGPHSHAHAYHMLRIEIKKLRYMMEFFASLFEPDAYAELLKRVKKIQTVLGDHQDLDVQRRHLKEFAETQELHDAESRHAIEALRRTMARLEEQKRQEFREMFGAFATSRETFRRMICHG